GGVDVPASLVGALVAIAATLVLGGVAGAILGTRVFRDPSLRTDEVLVAAIVGAIVLTQRMEGPVKPIRQEGDVAPATKEIG
ncbi:MAG: hypothetical protein KY432_09970, partial [Acidobacteria bacterium]|nr:hypothetical protein [Acidobacteriota bacterium]